jgi:hypothetical protein
MRLFMCRSVLIVSITMILVGCSQPADWEVRKDFQQVVSQNLPEQVSITVIGISTGEGDAGNVYKHVSFSALANETINVDKGILAGTALTSGRAKYKALTMLYQSGGENCLSQQWCLTWSKLDP